MLANDRALAAANPDVPERRRDVSLGLEKIAKMKFDAGDTAGALTLYEESLVIRRRPVRGRSHQRAIQAGSILRHREGRRYQARHSAIAAGALAAYQEMLGLDREVAAANIGDTKRQRVVSVDLNKIADVKLVANDTDGALAAVGESLNIARHIALTAPDNMEWQRDISVSLERLGNIKSSTGDKQGALQGL